MKKTKSKKRVTMEDRVLTAIKRVQNSWDEYQWWWFQLIEKYFKKSEYKSVSNAISRLKKKGIIESDGNHGCYKFPKNLK